MAPYGRHFGKDDYERYGIFAEMSYLHGKGWLLGEPENNREVAGKQMLPGHPKLKAGLQDCYFDKRYKRLFIGEGLPRKAKAEEESSGPQTLFRPPSHTHQHSTPGDNYGCFTKKYKSFDPRPRKEEKGEKVVTRLFIPTSPGKKGGSGYVNTTINRYPKYVPTAYEPKEEVEKADKKVTWRPPRPGGYFDEKVFKSKPMFWVTYINTYPNEWIRQTFKPNHKGKSLGGCMEGCFSRWPKYVPTKYVDPGKLEKYHEELEARRRAERGLPPKAEAKKEKFIPPSRNKTYPMKSVMESKVLTATNNATWRTTKPVTYTREFL